MQESVFLVLLLVGFGASALGILNRNPILVWLSSIVFLVTAIAGGGITSIISGVEATQEIINSEPGVMYLCYGMGALMLVYGIALFLEWGVEEPLATWDEAPVSP